MGGFFSSSKKGIQEHLKHLAARIKRKAPLSEIWHGSHLQSFFASDSWDSHKFQSSCQVHLNLAPRDVVVGDVDTMHRKGLKKAASMTGG